MDGRNGTAGNHLFDIPQQNCKNYIFRLDFEGGNCVRRLFIDSNQHVKTQQL